MQSFDISMPHRHTVRCQSNVRTLDFEVELLSDGIVFYCSNPKVIEGKISGFESEISAIEAWLRLKFRNVEVDRSPFA